MSSFDWPNVVFVSAWRTLRRVFALVFLLSVCEVNLIFFLSHVTPSVVAVSMLGLVCSANIYQSNKTGKITLKRHNNKELHTGSPHI